MRTQQFTRIVLPLQLLICTPSSAFILSLSKAKNSFQPNRLQKVWIRNNKKHNQLHRQARLHDDADEAPVNVYDDVFDPKTCKLLHGLALEHSKRSHDGSSLFHRRSSPSYIKMTPLEKAIDSLLTSLNDTSPMVEYWSRPTYINMDAHADIDENTLKEEGVLCCPKNGHVLYLQVYNSNNELQDVGRDEESKRMGPTVVFPERKIAWGSVSPRTDLDPALAKMGVNEYVVDVENYFCEEGKSAKNDITNHDKGEEYFEKMAIVPAKNGRLLRFSGEAFHSVPKPPNRYLLNEKELYEFTKVEDEDCDLDDYYDDGNDEDFYDEDDNGGSAHTQQRSVLLFNTWPEGTSGPRSVLPDCIVDAVPDGIDIDDGNDDGSSFKDSLEARQWNEWNESFGDGFEELSCQPVHSWKIVSIDDIDLNSKQGNYGNVKIPLMGNPSRRGCKESEANGLGPTVEMNRAFFDCHKVSLAQLSTKSIE
ncbi:hypothetical protein ACHAXS_001361 [Conticribra weissflogii]